MPNPKNKLTTAALLILGVVLLVVAVPQLIDAGRMLTSGEQYEVVPHTIDDITEDKDRPPLRSNKPFSSNRKNVSTYQILTFTYTDASGMEQEGQAWSRGHAVQPDQQVTVIQAGPSADDFVRFDFFGLWATPLIWTVLAIVALLAGIKQLITMTRQPQPEEPTTES